MISKISNQYCLFIFLLMIILIETCDVEVRLKSNTEKPFQFHLSVEAVKYWSHRVTVTGKTVKKPDGSFSNYHVFHIKGPKCNTKHWHFFVWGLKKGSNLTSPIWKITDHEKLKMKSLKMLKLYKLQPYVSITVKENLKISMGPIFGILWCKYC
ncbi:hypothetical protein LOAG_09785 [Loa loa]|uniref:Uncharacterized protein n=1 Tax=Loa loa TaxID=7209 RepID=A0A1S0TR71_LOALO|nr:hypothetical protein LOAG_09785 [Loa loa]EFO18710.1 hypothetical protein LOAG_09785 [Loa loa]